MEATVRNSMNTLQRTAMWLAATWLAVAVAVWGLHDGLARVGAGVLIAHEPGPGGSCGSSYHPGLRFEALSEHGAQIVYMPDRYAYRIQGRVRVLGMGLDRVVENGTLRMPGADTTLGHAADGVVILGMIALVSWALARRLRWQKQRDSSGEDTT